MGNRSNVFIQTDRQEDGTWRGIGVYSHWGGQSFQQTAIAQIPAARGRVGDPAYFARIIVHRLLHADADHESETGHGLWVEYPCDNEHPILVINAMTGEEWFCGDGDYRRDRSEL
jgi:hypothetical protein